MEIVGKENDSYGIVISEKELRGILALTGKTSSNYATDRFEEYIPDQPCILGGYEPRELALACGDVYHSLKKELDKWNW